MSRYTDVDALMQSIRRRLGIASLDNLLESEKAIVKEIDSAPSIDIVRCAECKYWEKGETWSACTFWTGDIYEQAAVEADDFCSYGERKDEPQTEREGECPIR